jgi:hypothetical protein
LPDFCWYNLPKWVKIIRNVNEICQTAVKYTAIELLNDNSKIFILSKIYQKWRFWYENIPSGNPENNPT